MKRIIIFLCTVLLCYPSYICFIALAAESGSGAGKEPSNVKITVVVPEQAQEATRESASTEESALAKGAAPIQGATIKMYPSDISEIRDEGEWQIIKTYELNPGENPDDIPRDPFERQGWRFTLSDITRNETAMVESRGHAETVTLCTDTNELEKILPQLEQTMEFETDDGFVGSLSLDIASIKVEAAGTKTTSYNMRVTREYPRLSNNDTSIIPKTIEERGKSYILAGVDWRAGNTVAVDYDALPEYYTAVATYTATGTTAKVTGYTTTAVYKGMLSKLSQGKVVYKAYFWGEVITASIEMNAAAIAAPCETASAQASIPATGAAAAAVPKPTTESSFATASATAIKTLSGDKSNYPVLPDLGAWPVLILIAAVFVCGAFYIYKKKGRQNA